MFKVRLLPGYVFQEFSKTFILAFLAVIIVLFTGFGLKQVYVQKGLDFVSVFSLFPFLVAKAMPYALPFGMVCACALAYGRLAGDNEIDAMRTSGVHLHYVITPVLAFGLLASAVTYAADDLLSPMLARQSEQVQKRVLSTLVRRFGSIGSPTYSWQFKKDDRVQKIHLYVDDIDEEELRGVAIYVTEGDKVKQTIMAESGRLVYDSEKKQLTIVIRAGTVKTVTPERPARINIVPARIGGEQETFLPYDLSDLGGDAMNDPSYRGTGDNQRSAAECVQEIEKTGRQRDSGAISPDTAARRIRSITKKLNETLVEIYGRPALATSCFFLALVAVPLSIMIKRGHMLVAFLLGLLLVVAYMVTFVVGSKFLAVSGYVHPGLAVWAPNALLLGAGAWLMLRVFRA